MYFCPYHPEHGIGKYKLDSPLRKPGPGMILQAARDYDLDLAGSVLVGDRETDIQAGIAAGVGRNFLYIPAEPPRPAETFPTHMVIGSLDEVAGVLKPWPASS